MKQQPFSLQKSFCLLPHGNGVQPFFFRWRAISTSQCSCELTNKRQGWAGLESVWMTLSTKPPPPPIWTLPLPGYLVFSYGNRIPMTWDGRPPPNTGHCCCFFVFLRSALRLTSSTEVQVCNSLFSISQYVETNKSSACESCYFWWTLYWVAFPSLEYK